MRTLFFEIVVLALIFLACSSACSCQTTTPVAEEISSSHEDSSSSSQAPILEESSSSFYVAPLSSSEYVAMSSVEDISVSSSSQAVVESVASSSSSVVIESAASSSSISAPSSSSSQETEPLNPKPVWNDEFEGHSVDEGKWNFEIGNGANGWGNNEKEFYTNRLENAYVEDGLLHIRANKETYNGFDYTSARLTTKDKFSFTYGTVEARIALPVGKGIWPAFWMLGANFDDVGWPLCGEIDIIEAVNDEHIVYGTNHWGNGTEYATYGNNTKSYRERSYALNVSEFHVYKLTWDEKYIRMFVDDFMYHEILIEGNVGDTEEFHRPFFLLLNVAVAGNWPGFEVDDSHFPNEMIVDYIRVFD